MKLWVFVLEGVNAFAVTLYYNYLFFHLRTAFGFTNAGNLFLCAVGGLVYTVGSWYSGQVAQRRGYFWALRAGLGGMAVVLLAGSLAHTAVGHFATLMVWTVVMSLTWPSLEALTSEGEPRPRLLRLLGVYNVVWASTSGLANFVGGALLEKFGPGSIFAVPVALHGAQLALLWWLEKQPRQTPPAGSGVAEAGAGAEPEARRAAAFPPKVFLKMAWVANPFAYVAINALIPVIPRLAERFELSATQAGFFCSVWYFARAVSFALLWQWTRWHYRFGWLAAAYVTLGLCYGLILLGPSLWMLLVAQLAFGLGVGLVYYSSLFYSMDIGQTKGEHGGFHEAALGVGICVGPAVGAASLHFFPGSPNMNAYAVSGLLAAGLGWLLLLRRGRKELGTQELRKRN
jgi:predicted MFS family arabinose efflux permease